MPPEPVIDDKVSDTTPSPGEKDGDKSDDKPRLYTKEEVERKLKGQGKQVNELTAKLEEAQAAIDKVAAEKKKAADEKKLAQGKHAELLAQREAELEEANKTLEEHQKLVAEFKAEREAEHKAIADANKERMKKLPERLRKVPLPDDPKAASKLIDAIEEEFAGQQQRKAGTRTRTASIGGEGGNSIEDRLKKNRARFGRDV